jgi:hypothetical protein
MWAAERMREMREGPFMHTRGAAHAGMSWMSQRRVQMRRWMLGFRRNPDHKILLATK